MIEPSEAHRIAPLKPGDGVVFDAADWRSPEEPEEGGRIFEIAATANCASATASIHAIAFAAAIWCGARTIPISIRRRGCIPRPPTPLRKQPVSLRVVAREGEPLRTVWTVGAVSVTVDSDAPLGAARNRAIDEEYLRAQLGRLGNTPYELAEVELEIAGAPFAPSSMLNQLRRDAVEQLQAAQGRSACARPVRLLSPSNIAAAAEPRHRRRWLPTLHLLVRTPEQLDAALDAAPGIHHAGLSGSLRPASLDRSACAMPASRCAWPARACSSRAKRRSSISCSAAIARFWCAPAACWKRCAIARRAN